MEEKYGEVEEMNVCDNLGDHLVGNVYVKVGQLTAFFLDHFCPCFNKILSVLENIINAVTVAFYSKIILSEESSCCLHQC